MLEWGVTKCGVEFYNGAQLSHQFGLLQLIPAPLYTSLNEHFTERPVLAQTELEKVVNGFRAVKANFALPMYDEKTEASPEFDNLWKAYTDRQLSKPETEILPAIAPVIKDDKQTSRDETTSTAIGIKRKGLKEEEVAQDPVPKQPNKGAQAVDILC